MKPQKKLILLSITVLAGIVFAGIIGALLRLITLQALIITALIITPIFIQRNPKRWKYLLRNSLGNKSNRSQFINLPLSKKEAAAKSLESIDKVLNSIQNKVGTEGLRQEKERVENELQRRDLEVVIFGTGSSGKTSLIRALLNEIVGNVSARMGSTAKSMSYRLRLKGLDRGIQLIDTPGILEGGSNGRTREKEALMKAGRSDLIIFVIDNDLREAEFKIIKGLANVGKRIFLVLNKIDLRTEEEEEHLLALLRARTKGLIEYPDVVTTTSSPQSIPIPGGRPLQPLPDIDNLVGRLARVLYEDGEELLADNILIQCRNLDRAGKQLLDEQRENASQKCVDRYSWISSGVVIITPLPGIELLGTAAVNAQMVMDIAKIYGVDMTRKRAKELALSVGKTLTGLGIVQGGVSLVSSSLSLHIPTFVVGRVIQSVTAAWLTRVAGKSFISYFKRDQDWGDGGMQEEVQRQYDINRREKDLNEFIEKAIKRVVSPLRKSQNKQLPPRQRPREEEEEWPPGYP